MLKLSTTEDTEHTEDRTRSVLALCALRDLRGSYLASKSLLTSVRLMRPNSLNNSFDGFYQEIRAENL